MIILPSSSGSRWPWRPYHFQNPVTASSIETLSVASMVTIQLVGSVSPKKVSPNCSSAQTR